MIGSPRLRNQAGMTLSVAITNSANEILDSLPEPLEKFHLEPRCRVCRSDEMRKKVNDLLAVGRSYARHRARAGSSQRRAGFT